MITHQLIKILYMVQEAQLDYSVGKNNPQEFTQILIDRIETTHPFSREVIHKAVKLNMIRFPDISIDSTTWVSGNTHTKLTLGIAPMDSAIKSMIIFEDQAFNYTDEVTYRFVHEVCHDVVSFMADHNEELINLNTSFIHLRQNNSAVGMTALGGLSYYQDKGFEYQAREDIVELVTMFVWNPEYLQRYLDFISSAKQSDLTNLGLTKISDNTAKHIFKIIAELTKQFVEFES
jgi:hypothetical protein